MKKIVDEMTSALDLQYTILRIVQKAVSGEDEDVDIAVQNALNDINAAIEELHSASEIDVILRLNKPGGA